MFELVRVVSKGEAEALVVGVFKDRKLDSATRALDADGSIALAAARPECTGDVGRIAEAYPPGRGHNRVLIVGLGDRAKFNPGSLRTIGGALGRRLAQTKDSRVDIELAGALTDAKPRIKADFAGRCLGEGLGLIAWNFTRFKGKGTPDRPKKTPLFVRSSDGAFQEGLERGLALAASTNIARDLSETPPNIATPAYIAVQARAMAKAVGLSCRVMEEKELEKERLIGLLNVGKASENRPCMIRLEYTPKSAGRKSKGDKPIVLIGKTMTYDTGGLSIKPTPGMAGMKRDKDGGCAVLGAMHAVATVIKPDQRVVALLAVAENSISDEAYRPDDIIVYRNGVSVEVTNTDAEGRLVLADALIWACEKESPACIVDLATLTGGVVTALGSTFAGMFCEDDRLRERLQRAMDTSGERWWRLPHDQEYNDMMKSNSADIVNSNPNRKAHPIQGAAFLSFFVDKSVPWAHIDIAGVHAVDSDSGPFIKGPTGWGVRLLADFLTR